jgi:DnaJ-class molecular chaperone
MALASALRRAFTGAAKPRSHDHVAPVTGHIRSCSECSGSGNIDATWCRKCQGLGWYAVITTGDLLRVAGIAGVAIATIIAVLAL